MSLNKFGTYLEARGRSKSTVSSYLQVARSFMDFTGKTHFTDNDVMQFLASKESGTYKRFLYFVLKSFFKALNMEWSLSKEDVPSKNEPKRPYFNIEETMKILNAVDKHGSLRDKSLIHVAAITGARRNELRNLNRDEYKNGRVYIRTLKKGKPRWRLLDPATRGLLETYLESRNDGNPALFMGRKGRPSTMQLTRILKKYLKLAGIKKPRAGYHSFRRGLATILHKRGLSEKEIQEYLGWSSPFMVHEYIALEPGEVEEKVRAVHPFFLKEKEEE